MNRWLAFALSWVMILGGSLLAHNVQTDGGKVAVSEVRATDPSGVTVSGLLYRPVAATAQHPAPAVLASHGYINTREMQSAFAIELSRRGYVVLAMDMTGHGYSGGIVGTAGFGGPAALKYLKSLPFVDRARVGLEGHSMGSGPVMAAALSDPDGYRAIVLEGSTPGLLGAPAPQNPHNLAVVFGQYDEFAGLMWGAPKGSLVAASPKLAKVFGVASPVEVGRVYGDIAAGTARRLTNPPVTHPWEHFSRAGVGDAVSWFDATLRPGEAHGPTDQVWLWKEVGTLIALLGAFWLLITTFDVVLTVGPFRGLETAARPAVDRRDSRWWLALVLTAALPAVTYLPLMKLGNLFRPSLTFPQGIQNQLVVWALGTALIGLVLGLLYRRRPEFTNRWGLGALAAVKTIAVAYISLLIVDLLFKTDYRFWVVGLKPLTPGRALTALTYLPFWTVFFLLTLRGLAANLAVRGESLFAAMSWSKIAMAAGFGALVVWEYATLFSTGLLGTPTEPLNVIVAIQFIPLLGMIGVLAAWTYRRTNSYVPGALICAMLISWYVSSGTANHVAPGFSPQPPPGAAARK